ncbi:MAG: glycosyltransferase family 1 protein, partial [Candidatus Schekmanbacteria bacterium]
MGGAIESLLLLMENLNSENFLPLVVTSSEGKFTDELKKRKIGYEIVKMEMWRKAKGFLSRPFILKKLIDYAKKQSVSLIHCNTLWDNPYGSIIAKNLKIPLVCHIRNTFSYDKIKKYNLASADRIICVSQKVAESFNGWKYRDKVEIIYNGVDMNRFNPSKFVQSEVKEKFSLPPHSPLVGIVGRVSPQKGQLEVIRAAAIIKEKVPSIKVMIVGETSKKESEYLNFLKNEAENLGVSENVVFAGYRSNIAEITSAFDVAVFPSLEGANEGFGRSLIEAMAMKKPVVATLTG